MSNSQRGNFSAKLCNSANWRNKLSIAVDFDNELCKMYKWGNTLINNNDKYLITIYSIYMTL